MRSVLSTESICILLHGTPEKSTKKKKTDGGVL